MSYDYNAVEFRREERELLNKLQLEQSREYYQSLGDSESVDEINWRIQQAEDRLW